jgi:hypothetical protein
VALGAEKMLENGSILALQLKAGKDYLILREDEIIGTLTQTGKTAGRNKDTNGETDNSR